MESEWKERKNQIIKTNRKDTYRIKNTNKYIPQVLQVRQCYNISCKKIIEDIPNITYCRDCYNKIHFKIPFDDNYDIL